MTSLAINSKLATLAESVGAELQSLLLNAVRDISDQDVTLTLEGDVTAIVNAAKSSIGGLKGNPIADIPTLISLVMAVSKLASDVRTDLKAAPAAPAASAPAPAAPASVTSA